MRVLTTVLLGATVVAAGVRYRFEQQRRAGMPALIARVRRQLSLAPVLAAEVALRTRPDDPRLRLQLAGACEGTGDPAGAALALYPLVVMGDKSRDEAVPRFVAACAQLGWLDEAAEAMARASGPPTDGSSGQGTPGHPSLSLARARLDLAAACAIRGESARAAMLLASLEQDQPATLGADEWLDGAVTWYQCRRPGRAGDWARRGVAKRPDDPASRAVLARCLLAAGQPQAALSAVSPHHPLTPSSDPLLDYWRARAELMVGDPARRGAALAQLARMAQSDPPNPVAAFEAGRADLRSGQAARAVPLLTRAAGQQYQEVLADDLLAQAYTVEGHAAAAAWARARAQAAHGQLAAAEASYRRCLAPGPAPPGVSIELARVLSLEGKPRQALPVLERPQSQQPDSLELALAKADALNQLDRFADQARELESAAARFPARADVPLTRLGKMYYETRQYDRVIPVMERALQVRETNADGHGYLGLCEAQHPDNPVRAERAVGELLRATALDPTQEFQWSSAGAVLQRLGYLSEAAACYRHAIDAVSSADGPYFSLAQAMRRQGRAREAALLLKLFREKQELRLQRGEWENRISANRHDAAAHEALGELLLRSGSYREAYPYLLIAASLRPRWKAAQLRLADVCALLDYRDLWQQAEQAAGGR